MIITQTPFRMSFFGGGTDMESFFRENGGAVLSTTCCDAYSEIQLIRAQRQMESARSWRKTAMSRT